MDPRKYQIRERTFFQLFFSIYFILYVLPFPATYYPGFLEDIIISFGENILNFEAVEKIVSTGSGDTTFDFAKLIFLFLLSLFLTFGSYFYVQKKQNLEKILLISISYSKYFLIFNLLLYGFIKLNHGQFPFPDFMRLDQKVGELSPMGLLWTFLGYSNTYSTFGAFSEIAAGILLLFRRTSIIGAIVSFAVMMNVFVLNISYDVPVKLFSLHLVLISVFIIHQNLFQIFQFLMGKTAKLDFKRLELKNKWLKVGRILFITFLLVSVLFPAYNALFPSEYSPSTKKDLKGIYILQQSETDNEEENRYKQWRKFILDKSQIKIVFADESVQYFDVTIDRSKKLILLKSIYNSTEKYQLKYKKINSSQIEISGIFMAENIKATFRKVNDREFELLDRNYNWISEYPYNR